MCHYPEEERKIAQDTKGVVLTMSLKSLDTRLTCGEVYEVEKGGWGVVMVEQLLVGVTLGKQRAILFHLSSSVPCRVLEERGGSDHSQW